MNNNQTLSESESLMAWLDRRIEEVITPASFIRYQRKFLKMWEEVFPNDEVPQHYRDKVTKKYEELKKKS